MKCSFPNYHQKFNHKYLPYHTPTAYIIFALWLLQSKSMVENEGNFKLQYSDSILLPIKMEIQRPDLTSQ